MSLVYVFIIITSSCDKKSKEKKIHYNNKHTQADQTSPSRSVFIDTRKKAKRACPFNLFFNRQMSLFSITWSILTNQRVSNQHHGGSFEDAEVDFEYLTSLLVKLTCHDH